MFKVETTGVSQTTSVLSMNGQSNFDFELSFCDDGTTDDLFDTFADTASERNAGRGGNASSTTGSCVPCTTTTPGAVVGSSSSPLEASHIDTSHIKIEPDEADPTLPIGSDLASESSPSVSSAVCTSAMDSSPVVVQQDSLRTPSLSGESGPSDSTTPSPTNSSNGSSASGNGTKKGT